MLADSSKRDRLRQYAADLRDDDGVDPRQFFKQERKRNENNRKALQLCRQVAQTLDLVLSGELDDEMLHNLQVVAVEPAPDTSQLCVTLRADVNRPDVSVPELLDRLSRATGRLRTEVASAITRRRVPKLVFQVVGPAGQSEVNL